MRSIESNSSLIRALLTVNPYTLGGLPFSGNAAWNVASLAALMVPRAESPSHRNSSAPDPRPVSRLGNSFGGSDRFVPSPLAFDAALDRAFAPSALRRALADSRASLVHSVTASPLAGLAAQMVTLRATSGAIATFSNLDDTAVFAWESHDTSGARVSMASAVTAAKSCGSGPSSPLASPRSRIREARAAKASDSPFTAAVRWDPPPGVRTVLQNAATVAGSAGPAVNDHRNGVGPRPVVYSPRPSTTARTPGTGLSAAPHMRSSSVSVPHGPVNGSSNSGRTSSPGQPSSTTTRCTPGDIRAAACARSTTSLISTPESGTTRGSNRMRTVVPCASGLRLPVPRSFCVSARVNGASGSKSLPSNTPG
jgi:hypothetical protein